ncbi:MAG: hypothetical protein AAF909_13080, partial [Pseudomonadota bacterium]
MTHAAQPQGWRSVLEISADRGGLSEANPARDPSPERQSEGEGAPPEAEGASHGAGPAGYGADRAPSPPRGRASPSPREPVSEAVNGPLSRALAKARVATAEARGLRDQIGDEPDDRRGTAERPQRRRLRRRGRPAQSAPPSADQPRAAGREDLAAPHLGEGDEAATHSAELASSIAAADERYVLPGWAAAGAGVLGVGCAALAAEAGGGPWSIGLLSAAAGMGGLGAYGLAERMTGRRAGRVAPDLTQGFKTVFDTAPEIAALVDRAGRVQALNGAARAEIARRDLRGPLKASDLLVGEFRDQTQAEPHRVVFEVLRAAFTAWDAERGAAPANMAERRGEDTRHLPGGWTISAFAMGPDHAVWRV